MLSALGENILILGWVFCLFFAWLIVCLHRFFLLRHRTVHCWRAPVWRGDLMPQCADPPFARFIFSHSQHVAGIQLLQTLYRHGFHYGENGRFHFYLPWGSGSRLTRATLKPAPILCSIACNRVGDGFNLEAVCQRGWYCKQIVLFTAKGVTEQGHRYYRDWTHLLDQLSREWEGKGVLYEEYAR